MPNQEIGVKSQFTTREFSRGLGIYLKGLANAIAATNNTVAAINNLGAAMTTNFATMQRGSQATVTALRALVAQANATNRAVANAQRAPRQRATGGAGAAATLNAPNARTVNNINNATRATRNLGSQAQRTSVNLQTLSTRSIAVGTAIGTIAANAIGAFTRGLGTFGGQVLEIISFFERLDLSIAFYTARSFQAEDATLTVSEALALGAKEAQGLSIWLQRLAVASPFTTRDVGTLFRTAQAYGLTRKEAELLTPLLLDFAAVAGLDADILERLALAMGQVRARGKLTGEEVRQLGNSGIPIRDILVKALGIANSEFDELLESGALTSDVVIPAIIGALKEFEGAGKRIAFETIGGIVSAFEELREIGTAKFFTALLEPLKKSFQDLFAILNQPKVLAFIQVLGQELGTRLKNAVFGVVAAINGVIAAWRALEPVMQQQIIVFAATTAGVIALIGAFGLLSIAVGILLSPVALIAATVGFLVSEWTSGFAVLRSITARVGRTVGNTLKNISKGFQEAGTFIAEFFTDIGQFFSDAGTDFAQFGLDSMIAFAGGIRAGSSAITNAIQGLTSLFAFWLAPGSPPRIAPNIDDWGTATMQEYIDAFGNANVKKSLGGTMSIVSDTISQELIDARRIAVDRLNAAHPDLQLTLVDDLNRVIKEGFDQATDSFEDTGPVEQAAGEAGIRVSDAFVDSFLSRIPELVPRMSEELQEVLRKIGGGARLSREGALSFGKYLEGFGEADFSILDETSNVVGEFLQSLVDAGQIEEVDVARLLFGAREDLVQGIQDIQRVGSVTQDTMQRIKASAGGASGFVLQLLESYAPLAAATNATKAAQEALNAVTQRYKDILTPLRRELEAINEASSQADEEEKVLSLRRLIANQAVSDRRRQNAQLEINKIFAERRVRGLESERDAAIESGQEEVDARQKTQDMLEEQFSTLQRNIQAQLEQLGLYGEEASIIRRLREEAEKLREKEMTTDELRLKFLELQGEELSDLILAAKAKYDLDRADSTELEKQQAQITLAEVALRRRNREAEAIKLGIPVGELTKMRDFVVTLDDIGVKSKEAFSSEGLGGLGDSIVDADAITKEWETTLEQVRDRWAEIKAQILETATAINNNLPSFLKIFPETEGGEPPIIQFIRDYGKVIVGLAVAVQTFKITSTIIGLVAAVRSLMLFGTVGGAAAGGAAGAGAAGGLTGMALFVSTLTSVLGAFTLAAVGAVAAAQAVGAAFGALGIGQNVVKLGDFGEPVQEQVDALLSEVTTPDPIAKQILGTNIQSAIEEAVLAGVSNAGVSTAATTAFNKAIADGFIADTPENRAAINTFRTGLLAILKEQRTGSELEKFTLVEDLGIQVATPEEAATLSKQFQSFLNGITNEQEPGAFAGQVQKVVTDGVTMGLTNAEIGTLIFDEFNKGVGAGLIADTEENRKSVASYMDGLITLMRTEAKIKSPSILSEVEIGIPLGEGILKGINAAFTEGSTQVITTIKLMSQDLTDAFGKGRDDLIAAAENIRLALGAKFLALRITLGIRMAEIVTAQKTGWTTVRTDSEAQVEALRLSTKIKFESIRLALFTKMAEIKSVVVDSFKAMRTESETVIGEMRTSIINLFSATDDSLLTDLRVAMLGLNQATPKAIGRLFIEGIALGITDNKQTLADAMIDALQYSLITAGQSRVGLVSNGARLSTASSVSAPLESRIGAQPNNHSAATTTNVSRVTHYNLNVTSSMASQGVIQDFGIMRTLG